MTRVADDRALWLSRHALPHEVPLRAWLRRRRLPDVEIDDVVQETYAKLAALESVEAVQNPRTYMFQIAHSVIATHVRRARIVSIHAVADLDGFGLAAPDPSPEQQIEIRDELRQLGEAIASLPAKSREVFALRRVDGLSQREVAVRLGISESTVEKHMAKGIRRLMDRFGRGGKPKSHASMGLAATTSWKDDQASDGRGDR